MALADASDFSKVQEAEKVEIAASRGKREDCARKDGSIGLALSGGGIRSATFNLGVLQAMARVGFFPCVDYLSTVSGGGYIGSWLVAWIKRSSFKEVVAGLHPDWKGHPGTEPAATPQDGNAGLKPESKAPSPTATPQIEFLRDYSNYLTPHVGFLTADTWTAIVTVARNLLLNLLILVLAAVAVLLVPHWLLAIAPCFGGRKTQYASMGLAVAAFTLFGWFYWPSLRSAGGTSASPSGTPAKQPTADQPGVGQSQGVIVASIGFCLFASAYLAVSWAGKHAACLPLTGWVRWVPAAFIVFWLVTGVVLASQRWSSEPTQPDWNPYAVFLFSLLSYAVLSLYAIRWMLAWLAGQWHSIALVSWGVPLVVLVYLLAAALQVGLSGLLLPNEVREWTARLGAWLLILSLVWVSLFGIAIYSPLGVLRISAWLAGTLTLAWMVHTVAGVWSAFSTRSGRSSCTNGFDLLAVTAPPVFALGLLVLLSFGIYRISASPAGSPGANSPAATVSLKRAAPAAAGSTGFAPPGTPQAPAQLAAGPYLCSFQCGLLSKERLLAVALQKLIGHPLPCPLWEAWLLEPIVFLVLFFLAWLLSLRIDVNEFSLHTFYRNRLVRSYLGASRPDQFGSNPFRRRPNRFMGFDPADDVLLADLAGSAEPSGASHQAYEGPYPIICAALNLTHGERLAWQERKAESFTFTPRYCGGTVSGQDVYLPTREYAYPENGVYLGTAMAISGAAVSPLVGFHYSSSAGFLMTVFNARLGQWLTNPAAKKIEWNRFGPRVGLWWLFKELFGLMDDQAPYVYLSDGGHFENLGLYELVRRRVKSIVACDASADPGLTFEDLGNAIRKCRADFGIEIEIEVGEIQRNPATGFSTSSFAVGTIKYSQTYGGTKADDGVLLYLKASLTGAEPEDVLQYHTSHAEFPHQSTADQWFDASQFETYRRLGQSVAETAFHNKGLDPGKWRP